MAKTAHKDIAETIAARAIEKARAVSPQISGAARSDTRATRRRVALKCLRYGIVAFVMVLVAASPAAALKLLNEMADGWRFERDCPIFCASSRAERGADPIEEVAHQPGDTQANAEQHSKINGASMRRPTGRSGKETY